MRYCSECDTPESTTQPAKVWFCHECKTIFDSSQLIRLLDELEISPKNIENIQTELSNRQIAISL